MKEATIKERLITAEHIARILRDVGYGTEVWTRDDVVRVYVTRQLSRRRRQEMGYVEIPDDGDRNYKGLDRARAGTRDLVEGALETKETR